MTEEEKDPDFWENAEDEVTVMTLRTFVRDSVLIFLGILLGVLVFLARWTFGILSFFAVGATVSSGIVLLCMLIAIGKLAQGGTEVKKSFSGMFDKKVRETTAAMRRGENTQENGFQKPPTRKETLTTAVWRVPSWVMVGAALFAWLPLWGSCLIAVAGYAGMTISAHYFGKRSRDLINMQTMMNPGQEKDTWEI